MTATKKAISLAILLLISIVGSAGAQDTSERQPNSKVDAVIKMSGISPAVGVNYQINNESKVRAIGFISVNSLGSNENYLLDLSYLRNMDWISAEDIDSYWGLIYTFNLKIRLLVREY